MDDAAGGDPDEQLGIDSASGLVAVQDPVEETVPELGNTEDAGQVVNDPQVQALPQTDDGSAVEENAPEASPERTEVSVMIGIMVRLPQHGLTWTTIKSSWGGRLRSVALDRVVGDMWHTPTL